MDIQQLLAQARDTITVKRVFGDPIDKDGVTVIPVAKVMGGAGAGGGSTAEHGGGGSGGGFGVGAAPAGVFVIKGDAVTWQPALDLNRVILGGQLVAIAVLLLIRAIVNARANGDRR
ncbi:MAG: sporulation protein [Chloroflexota bacterium]|nr:sporulation protein [Chloroflexota bacterium]